MKVEKLRSSRQILGSVIGLAGEDDSLVAVESETELIFGACSLSEILEMAILEDVSTCCKQIVLRSCRWQNRRGRKLQPFYRLRDKKWYRPITQLLAHTIFLWNISVPYSWIVSICFIICHASSESKYYHTSSRLWFGCT